ncbi:response regulator [Vibrio sp. 10N.261.46.E12]|uniref:ATP-binding response regulator n=1 Tax=unclassified Vibrio TaxID=2614977 RepID=UPI000978C2CD|nr:MULTISPECIES: hybrid sensor histidine kinase/response regulator [unclassified Vibrio]OMO38029.1 hypothetical protein BH584_19435 [Vibrio sp. 10N.261.45.E1]PMJ36747.1 hypothetical protein BCU27_23130 [Vibrio sp. 10N.286.45.B6]PML84098.1 hypothetical protein BCT66_18340 [Vibrio sp. 10N.261.49.E11]PMM67701.1 hypothetical protein BCT48_14375 [Vibrio sp. 10N.261.46.F12]PMM86467.1 hypothetical protein BCT46_07835 [Vibrio sp. 10N.261.46.E8]
MVLPAVQNVRNEQYASLTVLVVDDHQPMLKIIKSMLHSLGFARVLVARDGLEALSLVENNQIDLIISDWNMPKMNGFELLEAVRIDKMSNTPFIIVTANINQEDVKAAILAGVSEYLSKPFNIKSLKTKIGRAFSSPIPKTALTPSAHNTAQEKQSQVAKSKYSILIVDDEPNNITVLTELLKKDFSLQACLSGEKALKICSKETLPDLILLDIMMPEMDGLMVCEKLKNNPLTEHIPIIFISALSQTKDVIKGLSMGAVDYIAKPISPEITRARIDTHIEQVRQREKMALQLDTMIENMRLKEDMERITHHDLKNPLSVIMSAVDSLQDKQSYSQQEIDFISESACTMKDMIDQQMIIHQLENNSTERELLSINALEFFNKILYGQKGKCKKNNVFIRYHIAKVVSFLGNQVLCFNLFNNLIANAIEASTAGSEITITSEQVEDHVVFHIHNEGVIPAKVQARFFDKFITHGKEKGTGLGTYSAKLSALAQGGDVSFSSTKKDGTTLTVTLKRG